MLFLTILLILWPYLFFAGCAVVFSLNGNGGTLLVLLAIGYIIISAILHHLYRSYTTTLDIPLQQSAKYNLLLKLIPAACDAILYGALTVTYIKTMIDIANGAMMCVPMFLIYFVILIPYNLSRIFSLITSMRVNMYILEESRWKLQLSISRGRIWLHTIMHLLPVCHIISNILVYRKIVKLQPENTEP